MADRQTDRQTRLPYAVAPPLGIITTTSCNFAKMHQLIKTLPAEYNYSLYDRLHTVTVLYVLVLQKTRKQIEK